MDKQLIQSKVCEIVRKHSLFNGDSMSMDFDLRDKYGIDSIALVELLVDIECEMGITIDSNTLSYDNFSTTGRIVEYLSSQLNV